MVIYYTKYGMYEEFNFNNYLFTNLELSLAILGNKSAITHCMKMV